MVSTSSLGLSLVDTLSTLELSLAIIVSGTGKDDIIDIDDINNIDDIGDINDIDDIGDINDIDDIDDIDDVDDIDDLDDMDNIDDMIDDEVRFTSN